MEDEIKKTLGGREYTVSKNPYTGEVLGKYPVNTREEIFEAIKLAREVQKNWTETPLKERIKKIERVRDYVAKNAELISEEISKENGKSPIDALATEVLPATIAVDYYCKMAKKILREEKIRTGNILLFNKRSRIIKSPYGVVAIISPWNYPFSIPFSEIVEALLAGNAVILKTATISQLVGHRIKECIEVADLPQGLFTLINTPGKYAGDYFIEGGVDKLFFTGSVETGKYLMKKASERLLPLSLELGGNDPMIILKDADIERAAWGTIWAGFQNAGQSCGGIERVYVAREIYTDYLEKLKEYLETLNVGPILHPNDFSTDIAGLTKTEQYTTVKEHVEDALEKGAKIYYQHKVKAKSEGYQLIYPPTVVINVNHSMKLMRDETFGPVVGVMPFNNIEEAIQLANDSHLALTASIWTKNRKIAKRIASYLEAGVITINDHLMSHGLAETPWGGFKYSGLGKTHGEMGFREMLKHKVVVDDLLYFTKRDLWWHPYSEKLYRGLEGAVSALYGAKLFTKLKGWGRVAKTFFRIFHTH